jgi:hypothetical protein
MMRSKLPMGAAPFAPSVKSRSPIALLAELNGDPRALEAKRSPFRPQA